jgi:hypothetical protein
MQSAEQLHGKLMVDHMTAMLCHDMEDLIDSIFELGRKLGGGDERMRSLNCSAADKEKYEDQWDEFNRALENLSTDALGMVQEFNNEGYQIKGSTELKKLRNDLRVANAFQLQRIRRSIKQADDRQLTSLSAVRDELSH